MIMPWPSRYFTVLKVKAPRNDEKRVRTFDNEVLPEDPDFMSGGGGGEALFKCYFLLEKRHLSLKFIIFFFIESRMEI